MVGALVAASGAAQARTLANTINFDDVAAPCTFDATVALRDQYSGVGVHFRGGSARNGGGILDECGGFGVTGYSSPNFLAFNTATTYSDGGVPTPPQGILFDNAAGGVQIRVGSATGGTVQMIAYNANGQVVGRKQLAMASQLKSLTIVAQGIRKVVLQVQGGTYYVFDDLAWQ